MPDHYEPPNALRFFDLASQREMLLDYDIGWLCYRHPDGQWVTLRKATPDDLARLSRAGAVHPGDVADRPARTARRGPDRRGGDMSIQLPADLLPCIDDYQKLRIIADYVGERGDVELEKHLRWTAHEWEQYRGLKRRDVEVGMIVWARYSSSGWSRAVVAQVTARKIIVEFPNRKARHWTQHGVQRAERSWWDLEPRGEWQGTRYGRPKPRKGYGTQKNAALAAALCFDPTAKVSKAKSEPIGQLLLWGQEDGQ